MIKEYIRLVKEEINSNFDMNTEISNDELMERIKDCVQRISKQKYISLSQKSEIIKGVYNSMRGLDILQTMIDDKQISEIMINGYKDIFVEKNGRIQKTDMSFETPEKLENIVQNIVSEVNRTVNESSPIVDARLKDGSRVNVVLPPIAIDGVAVTIRKFPDKPITMEKLIQLNSINEEAAEFLKKLVQAKYNIFISGGTGSGKTTFLNILSNFIPSDERIITIEDSAELQIRQIQNLVRLETRNSNLEGKGEINIRELIKSALRMRPERIIVGEVRGQEALDMLQAMNTGHDGSISTGHANSAYDMLSRIETMVLMGAELPLSAVRQQIASGIDIIVQLGRLRDKTRRVLEICEIAGIENGEIKLNSLYKFCEEGEKEGRIAGKLKRTSNELLNIRKLEMAGMKKDELFKE